MELRIYRPWQQSADPHPLARGFRGDRLGQGDHVGLAGVVDRLVWPRNVAPERADVEDAAAPARPHAGQIVARQRAQRPDVEVDHSQHAVRRAVMERPGQADPGVVDDHIGIGAVRGERGLDGLDRAG